MIKNVILGLIALYVLVISMLENKVFGLIILYLYVIIAFMLYMRIQIYKKRIKENIGAWIQIGIQLLFLYLPILVLLYIETSN